MTKKYIPPYVYAKGKKGYLYFIRPGICQRIKSAPNTAEFAAEYAILMRGNYAPAIKTIGRMIDAYQKSEEWARLSVNTRKSYARHLVFWREKMGEFEPDRIKTDHIKQLRERLKAKPTDLPQHFCRLIDQRRQFIPWYDRHQLAGYPYADAVFMRGEGSHATRSIGSSARSTSPSCLWNVRDCSARRPPKPIDAA